MSQSFFARRSFSIIVVAVFFMPFLWMGSVRALKSNRNDVKDWLPSHFEETKLHREFQKFFPHEQFVLVSWEGCTLEDDRLELLARKLETYDPSLKKLGITGSLAKILEANKLRTLREIEEHPNVRSIDGVGPEEGIRITKAINDWVSPFKSPVLTGRRAIDELKANYPDLEDEEVFYRLEGSLIGKDHDKTCLVVTLSESAKGKQLRETLETIRNFAAECRIDVEAGELHMGGPPVDNVAIDIEGERTLMRLAGLSAVVGLGVSWLCFRSVRLTFLVFFCAILAAGLGMAGVHFTGLLAPALGMKEIGARYGTCDAILLSMPSLVYVLAISGSVHIINYYHDSVREYGLEGAPERALRQGLVPCALAAFTTSLGLGSLLASHLIPIQKFGVYSAWGVLATLTLLFLFLPACLYFFPSRDLVRQDRSDRREPEEVSNFGRFWLGVGRYITKHNGLVAVGCLVVMAFFAMGLRYSNTSVKLMKLFSPGAQIIEDYTWLEKHLGPLVPMEVVLRVDNSKCRLNTVQRMRMARDVEHAIEEQLSKDVGGALSGATFAPDIGVTPADAAHRLNWSFRDLRYRITGRFIDKSRWKFKDYLQVDGEATLEELGIRGDLAERLKAKELDSFRKLYSHDGEIASIDGIRPEEADDVQEAMDTWRAGNGTELWRVNVRVWALTDLDYSVFIHTLKEKVEKVLDEKYRKLSKDELAAGVKPIEGVEVQYTGLVPLIYKAQHELLNGLFTSLKWAFVLIAIVMIVVLRSPLAGLVSMIPNIFPVVVIFGAMGWMGILIDVGTMMTASVALGVAVDDTIHFLTWYRRGLDEGRDRKGAVMLAYERCATAMSQTTLIGGLGLAVFAFSTFTPTQRFGYLMLALLAAALVGDLIFLPAVLSSPIGRFFRSRRRISDLPDDSDDDGQLIAVPIDGGSPSMPDRGNSSRQSNKAS
ncbi:MAG: MMPL family transporter [Candidatus Nealsonbacteria bacterium]|nr:MMPL family transporter [Candidatus Nealsonbacteria bacterium]